ncbi:LPS export ABC transporter periplasmic protein LptC [Thiomicrospira sp.]|uniref:LPS export ABC transporter periplasmic protein LptC n=1 Tax=Thiomicrospira sp. TaxID=935 RepID=UPI002F928936
MLKKRAFIFSLILGFLALIVLLNNQERNQNESQVSDIDQDDWQISQSQSWLINRTQPTQQQFLQTPFMRKQNERILINNPHLILQEPTQLISLDSKSLEILNQTQFEFKDKVIVKRYSDDTNLNQRLLTEHLTYNQTDEQLKSPILVTIESQNQITTGIGLIADLKANHTQLLSEVKTRYVP